MLQVLYVVAGWLVREVVIKFAVIAAVYALLVGLFAGHADTMEEEAQAAAEVGKAIASVAEPRSDVEAAIEASG